MLLLSRIQNFKYMYSVCTSKLLFCIIKTDMYDNYLLFLFLSKKWHHHEVHI